MQVCCELLASEEMTTGNLGLVFDDFIISETNSVIRFISMQDYFLLEISAEQLIRMLRGLTKRGMSFTFLFFLYRLSVMLAEDE